MLPNRQLKISCALCKTECVCMYYAMCTLERLYRFNFALIIIVIFVFIMNVFFLSYHFFEIFHMTNFKNYT